MKTYKEIIDETVEAYKNVENRAVNGSCGYCYKTPDGKCCAVGRCMIDPQGPIDSKWEDGLSHWGQKQLEVELKPEYRGLDFYFWEQLQKLHDRRYYWNTDFGLSEEGKEYVKSLHTEWDNVEKIT